MAEIGAAYVSVLPSAKGFGRDLSGQIDGEMDTAGKSAGSKFGTALKVGALAAIGGAVAVGKFLGGALEEAREAQVIGARTENVIEKMGNAANISAKQVGDLATSISNKTGVDDEAIQSGQNLLLTFGNIRNEAGKGNDIFNRTSGLMVDLSRAMGTDTKGAALQLGKALNDPIKGVSALTRSGVSFTEQQKDQIATLVESGDTLGAQKIILGEVEKQFGGAAEAMATPADKLKTTYGNLKEQIGTALIPVADRFLNLLLSAAPTVSAAISQIGPAFQSIQTFLAPFVAQITGLFGSGGSGSGLLASIGAFAQSIGSQMLPVLQTVGQTFTSTVLPALKSLGEYLVANLFPIFQKVAGVIRDQVVPIIASLAEFFYGTLYPAVIEVAKSVGEKLKPVFDAIFQVIQDSVIPTVEKLLEKFREYQPTIQKVIEVVVKIIGKVLEFAAAILANVLPPVIKFAGFLLEKLVPAVADVIGVVVKIIGKVIDFGGALIDGGKKVGEFAGKVVDLAQRGLQLLIDAVTALPGKIIALGGRFLDAGRAIIGKFVEGLKNAGGLVSDIAGNVWDALRGLLNSAIGKINAALSFTISLPGPDISINPPDIPYLAKGTNNFAGGLAVVGEKGPELVNLPRGSQVIPNNVAFAGSGRGATGGLARLSRADLDYLIAGISGGVAGGINSAVRHGERSAVA